MISRIPGYDYSLDFHVDYSDVSYPIVDNYKTKTIQVSVNKIKEGKSTLVKPCDKKVDPIVK